MELGLGIVKRLGGREEKDEWGNERGRRLRLVMCLGGMGLNQLNLIRILQNHPTSRTKKKLNEHSKRRSSAI